MEGNPLGPTKPARARHWLRSGKAKLVNVQPFVVQLTVPAGNHVPELVLGVDPGFVHQGIAVTNVETNKTLYMQETRHRTDIKERMDQRRMYRNTRRRRLRCRPARFLNRGKEGSLPPTLVSKVHSSVRAIGEMCRWFPIHHVVIETTKFDVHRMMNPDVQDVGYQHGPQFGYKKLTQYVLDRDGYTCQECGKKNVQLEVHHIKPRREQGADIPDNLVTLCRECHRKADNGLVCLKNRNGGRSKTRHATQTDIINGRIFEYLTENGIPFTETSGGDTKAIRQHFGLPKSHVNDAVCISLFYLYDSGVNVDDVSIPDGYLMEVCHAKGTYQRSQGQALKKSRYVNGYSHPAQQHHARILTNRSKCKFGFSVNGKVMYNGKTWFLGGVRSAGNCVLKDIYGNCLKTESGKSSKTMSLKNIVRVSAATGRKREWVKTG